MSGVVRDVYRYHHWPDRKDYWARTIRTDAFQSSPRPSDDQLHGIFGSTGEYVGYDNRVNYKNRELIRYHHWPDRRNWMNRYAIKKDSPTPARPSQSISPRKVPPLSLEELLQKPEYGSRRPDHDHERSEYDFMHNNNLTTTTAPFGTMHTPQLMYKIIGGKGKTVVKSLQTIENPDGNYGPRVPQLQQITESPTKADPRILEDSVRQHYNAQKPEVLHGEDNFSSNVQSNPTYVKNRPDSKSFSRYKNLPPIRKNFHKNHMSTVFEPEPWTSRGQTPPLAEDTEYTEKYHDVRPVSERPVNGYHSENNFKFNFQSDDHFDQPQKARSEDGMDPRLDRMRMEILERYLPPRNYTGKKLPSDPITFDQYDMNMLREIVCTELSHIVPANINNAYTDATLYDRYFTGWCRSDHLEKTLRKNNITLHPDTYRLLASMNNDPIRRDEEVDYMAILKNIEEMMAFNDPRWRQPENRQSIMNANPRKADGLPLLMKIVKDYLLNYASVFRLDTTKLRMDFENISMNEKRDTLTIKEITDTLYEHKLPLPESIVHDILRRHQTSNGQYSWKGVVSFFEKIDPESQTTGLPIPQSKRPLDYARQRESQRNSPPNSYRNGYDSSRDYPQSERERRILEKLRKTEEEIYELKNRHKDLSPSPREHEYEWDRGRRLSNKIDDIEEDILKLKFMYQVDEQNGFDKESREKHILDEIKRTKNQIDDLKNSNKNHSDRYGQQQPYSDRYGGQQQNMGDYGYGQMTERHNYMEKWNRDMINLGSQLYGMDEWRNNHSGRMPFSTLTETAHMFLADRRYNIPRHVINDIAIYHKNSLDRVDISGFLSTLGERGPGYDMKS